MKRKHLQALLSHPIFPKGFSGRYPLSSDVSQPFVEAVDVQETAIDSLKKNLDLNKKKGFALFRPKKWKGKNVKTSENLTRSKLLQNNKHKKFKSKKM